MNITGVFHVNVNCSDYEKSREFYALLGYKVMWEVPPTNTHEVAAAVGMPPYTVRGALLQLEGASGAPLIDLLEWREPHDSAPPYPHLYHLGIARICFTTRDLDADVRLLRSHGIEFLSETSASDAAGCTKRPFRLFQRPRRNDSGIGAERFLKFDPRWMRKGGYGEDAGCGCTQGGGAA